MTALPIDLPKDFVSLIKQGDTVTAGQILAKKDAPQDEIVNIMQALHVTRKEAKKVLKRAPGERINPGDIIAVKKSMFGKVKGKITSQISGTVLRYERVVRTDIAPSSLELISPVAGTVTLCNNKEIRIETKDAIVSDGVSLGTIGEGRLYILKESFEENGSDNVLYYLDSRVEGKIVFIHTITRDMIIKGDSIGAAGFLGTKIADEEISYLQRSGIRIPVLEVSDEFIPHLREWENKKIMIDIRNKAIVLRE